MGNYGESGNHTHRNSWINLENCRKSWKILGTGDYEKITGNFGRLQEYYWEPPGLDLIKVLYYK